MFDNGNREKSEDESEGIEVRKEWERAKIKRNYKRYKTERLNEYYTWCEELCQVKA